MSATKVLPDLAAMRKLAESLAPLLRCGDLITLSGDLGAGKTTFAQFLIGALSQTAVEVTSPTFNILQTYPVLLGNGTPCEFYHYDLYRIEHPSALTELGLDEALDHVVLIEWPDRLFGTRMPVALALMLTVGDDGARSLTATHADARFKEWITT